MPIVAREGGGFAEPDPEDASPDASAEPKVARIHVILLMGEVAVLEDLPERLRQVLLEPGAHPGVVERLFPKAYADEDEELERRRLIGEELYASRRERLERFERSLETAESHQFGQRWRLEEPTVELWLAVLNDCRILISTTLGIEDSEDMQQAFEEGYQLMESDLEGDEEIERLQLLVGLEFAGILQAHLLEALGIPLSFDPPESPDSEEESEGGEGPSAPESPPRPSGFDPGEIPDRY